MSRQSDRDGCVGGDVTGEAAVERLEGLFSYNQTRSAFRSEASYLIAKSPVQEAPKSLLNLAAILDENITLKEQKVWVDQERRRLEQEKLWVQNLLGGYYPMYNTPAMMSTSRPATTQKDHTNFSTPITNQVNGKRKESKDVSNGPSKIPRRCTQPKERNQEKTLMNYVARSSGCDNVPNGSPRIALSWMLNKEAKSVCCAGGILADGQGIGNTVSTIALILKERSPSAKTPIVDKKQSKIDMLNLDKEDEAFETYHLKEPYLVNNGMICPQTKIRPAACTLIVCPTSVLRQWSDELHNKVTCEDIFEGDGVVASGTNLLAFFHTLKEAADKSQGLNMYIKNLDDSIEDDQFKEMFSPFGSITSCKVMRDPKGISIGSGFIAFSSPEEASRALSEMNGKMIGGKPLYVAFAQRKEDRRARLRWNMMVRNNPYNFIPRYRKIEGQYHVYMLILLLYS
ncbi:hypothetical protein ACS0TY_009108 [Phlomoides rotata]